MKRSILRALQKGGILKYLNITSSITINNNIYKIPLIGGIGLENLLSLSETWMLRLLRILKDQSGSKKGFLDVGANTGQTLLKVMATECSSVYIGFEPNPMCVNYLHKLIDINNFINVAILPIAIGRETSIGKLQFYSASKTDASASLVQNFRKESSIQTTVNVPVFRCSHVPLLNGTTNSVGIIKIDVEGAELDVLDELCELIRKSRPFILMEILPVYSEKNTFRLTRQNEIERIINGLEYKMFRISKRHDDFAGLIETNSIGIHSDLEQCDYLFSPIEFSIQLREYIV